MSFYSDVTEKLKKQLDKFYKEKPHLLKVHEKDFLNEKDEYFLKANEILYNYQNKHYNFVKKNHKYNYDSQFMHIEFDEDTNIIILYLVNVFFKNPVQRIMFIDPKANEYWGYSLHNWKSSNVKIMLDINKNYSMSFYTGWEMLYNHQQRLFDPESIKTLKRLKRFKYIPLEKFEKVNWWLLLDATEKQLHHYEILLKFGARKAATELMLSRKIMPTEKFKMYKNELKKNRSYLGLERKNQKIIIDIEKRNKKQRFKNLVLELESTDKIKFDLGKYVLMTSNDFDEWKKEAKELNHCLTSNYGETYVEPHVSGEKTIMFLRKKNEIDQPFYTVELDFDEVRQVRTRNNKTNPKITDLVENFFIKNKDKIMEANYARSN